MSKMNHPSDQTAKLTWDDNNVPRSSEFDDVYFSCTDGLAETRYVFIDHNQLSLRWQQLATNGQFVIAETGFGTGLNFLAAWTLWRSIAPVGARLHFVSIEKYPLDKQAITKALAHWPELKTLTDELLANYPSPLPGRHRLSLDGGRVSLTLLYQDVDKALDELLQTDPQSIDAWFLDGFAPAKNPDMWSENVMAKIGALGKAGTTFATFTAVGAVKRALSTAGFGVSKVKGFGHKRDMLCGVQEQAPTINPIQSWYRVQPATEAINSVAVIGAGLAGCHVAHALAKRGLNVTVYDKAPQIASGGSGNPQGVLYTRLSPGNGELSEFALHSFCYASRHYRALFAEGLLHTGIDGELNGSLQLAFNDKVQQAHERLQSRFAKLPELALWLSAEQASELAGISLEHAALLLPQSGWLAPRSVCRALLDHPLISLNTDSNIIAVEQEQSDWQLTLAKGQTIRHEAVVIATGMAATEFKQSDHFPIKGVRGQISELSPANNQSPLLSICHEGYICPSQDGKLTLGATFDLDNIDTGVTDLDHQLNLAQITNLMPAGSQQLGLNDIAMTDLSGRAGIRCTTRDYLPIAGPVPDRRRFEEHYAELAKNARQSIAGKPPWFDNLYMCIGLGSRGMTYAPLCAELIADQLRACPTPLSVQLSKAVSPARFILRDLIRVK
ncbi:MAG: bifunctional tRNA (5-methylaminomethyl-2-thiouridine)(34)-methyltransferase MnmD/FAD-dependent 5-carboxymethylaminomethyl-2-thiouridine(34) oxidoreductase MnmC [Pseudomonadales bacterium]